MGTLHLLPGVDVTDIHGVPREDMAQLLEGVAARARAGELVALVVVAIPVEGGPIIGTSTPDNDLYPLIGALEHAKVQCFDRVRQHEHVVRDYDPPDMPA